VRRNRTAADPAQIGTNRQEVGSVFLIASPPYAMWRGMPSSPPDRYDPLPGVLDLPRFLLRKLAPRGRRTVLALGTVLLIALVAGAVFGLPAIRRGQRAQERADAHAAQVAAAARRIALTKESRPHFGRGPAAAGLQSAEALRARRSLMTRIEASVLADARYRLRSEGPYVMARCTAVPKRLDARPPQDDLALPIARLECLAVERAAPAIGRTPGVLIGQPFRARADFRRGRYAWCKIEESAGEGFTGVQVAVPTPRACGGG
jgi:hypothetical protein